VPANAILVVSGNAELQKVKELAEKWFAPIPVGKKPVRTLPKEPVQTEKRTLKVERKVPADAIYKAWHMCKRTDPEFYAYDLMSDILSRGNSARLYNALVKDQQLFSEINAFVMGDYDEGLFIATGKLSEGVSMEKAEQAIDLEFEKLKKELISETELNKVKNKVESTLEFSEMSILNKAMNLAFNELLGDAANVNKEGEKYQRVTAEQIQAEAKKCFNESNASVLYYHAKN